MKKLALAIVTMTVCVPAFCQDTNQNWKKDLEASFQQFVDFTNSNGDKYQCNGFIGKSIAKVYKTNTFLSDKHSRYLHINEISKSSVENSLWTKIGYAYDQKALDEAQNQANASKAVIAVYMTSSGIGP